jgi:hypothetical protein
VVGNGLGVRNYKKHFFCFWGLPSAWHPVMPVAGWWTSGTPWFGFGLVAQHAVSISWKACILTFFELITATLRLFVQMHFWHFTSKFGRLLKKFYVTHALCAADLRYNLVDNQKL